MLSFLKTVVKGSVGVTGEVVKIGTRVAVKVTSESIALPAELVWGKKELAERVRKAGSAVSGTGVTLIDRLGKPVASAVLTAPIRKAEHARDIFRGIRKAARGEASEGLKLAGAATGSLVFTALTLNLLDEENRAALGALFGLTADAVADLGTVVFGDPDAVAGLGAAVIDGDATVEAGQTLLLAPDVDAAAALADPGFLEVPGAYSVAPADGLSPVDAVAPPDAPAGPVNAGLVPPASAPPSTPASGRTPGLRGASPHFGGESLRQAAARYSGAQLQNLAQQIAEGLPADAPPDLFHAVRQMANGDDPRPVLDRVSRYMDLTRASVSVHFRGNG